jgi:hypothetical protein
VNNRLLVCAIVVTVVVAAGPTSAATRTESTIVPGVGIGKAKLGMTLAQVKRALGSSPLFNDRAPLSGGRQYVEYLWDLGEYRVGFAGGTPMRAVVIATAFQTQRMRSGVGVGTPRQSLRRKERVVPCRGTRDLPGGGGRWIRVVGQYADYPNIPQCLLGAGNAPDTVFLVIGEDCDNVGPIGHVPTCARYHVKEVIVSASYGD